jgi:phosphohistidine phosphatase
MRTLYLLRHAHSLEKQTGQTDKMRELSSIGASQCLAIGQYIQLKNYLVERVISSDAQRAMQTATLVTQPLRIKREDILIEEEIYKASIPSFLAVIQSQNTDHVLLVGHNPTISYFAEYFTDEDLGEVPPGTLMVLHSATSTDWSQMAKGSMQLIDKFIPD